ncbi:MAG: LysR substrate-binding domain-containing protein [Pseudomonadota bacterium]
MVPTPRAAALEVPLRDHLSQLHNVAFKRSDFDPTTASRTFRIAATDYAHSVVVPPLIETLRKVAPGIKIAALQFPLSGLRDQLADNLDFAIASERMMDDDIPARRLFLDDFLVVARKGHPRIKRSIDLDVFCSLEHLLVSPSGGHFAGAVDEALASLGRSRNVVASLPAFLLAPPIIRRTDSIAVLPSRVVALERSGLTAVAPPLEIKPFATVLGWHRKSSEDPGHKWLRQQIAGLDKSMKDQRTQS